MKKMTLLLTLAFCFAFIGCGNKDAEINAFTAEFKTVTGEIKTKVDANPTSTGVNEAQKAFDAKKAGLKVK